MNNNLISSEQWQETYDKMRPYQKEAIQFMLQKPKALNFDDMGLGKTVVTLSSVLHRAIGKEDFHILVLCTTNALYVWQEELLKWFGIDPIMYVGTPVQRKKIMNNLIKPRRRDVIVTTFGMIKELYDLPWKAVIADEIHQAGLLKHTNITYKNFKKLTKDVPLLYLLTGTPIRQGVIDLFAPLHLIAPNRFKNYWSFVNRHCITTMTPFGQQIERNPKDIPGFRSLLDNYMVRRLKTEVLKDLPGKQRVTVPIQMTRKQAKAHQEIIEELYYYDKEEDTLIAAPNQMTAILRARQLLVSPRLVGIDEDGAALNYLKEVGADLIFANQPFVIFTPFRQALPIVVEILQEIDPAVSIHLIHGGMTPAAFANSWQSFEKPENKKKVMVCVIKSGASFHATEAAECFFLGYEWDFNFNVQSEDRLCRLGQEEFVTCNYLLHKDTVDEDVKNKLNEKQGAADWIIGSAEQYQMMLNRVKGLSKQ